MRRKKLKKVFFNRVILGLTLLLLITIDALIKGWVHHAVREPIVVWKGFLGIDFSIQYITNRGMAWGMFPSMHLPIVFLRIAVIIGLFGYLCVGKLSFVKKLFSIFILAGAIGNVLDSYIYGHVIDMFHFVFWGRSYGIFNFADAMIFLGGFGLLISTYEKKRRVPSL